MNEIDIMDLDLNLLTTLQVLLQEASVTRAARRLGVGQPAASHALGRLRAVFGDPLLVRSGRSMVATPRAEALREPLARLLGDAVRLLRHRPRFDPSQTSRSFAVVCPDLLAAVLPRIMARLQREAPKARLEIVGRPADVSAALEDGRADLVVGTSLPDSSGLYRRGLGSVRFGVFAAKGHPGLTAAGKLRAQAWVRYPHVVVRSGSSSRSFVAAAVSAAGLSRRVGLVVPSFLTALLAASQTELFFAAPTELVRPLMAKLDLVHAPLPVAVPPVDVAAVWHERWHADPAHRFFRTVVAEEVGAALGLRAPRSAAARPAR